MEKDLVLKIFEGFSIQRWNDLIRPFDLVEMDKAGEKMVLAYIIGKFDEKKGYKISDSQFSYEEFCIEIEVPEFKKCHWRFEFENNRLYSGLRILEGKSIAKKYLSLLNDVYEKQEQDWAGWKWHNTELNDEFWKEVEEHPIKVVNSIVSELEQVRDATKEMNL